MKEKRRGQAQGKCITVDRFTLFLIPFCYLKDLVSISFLGSPPSLGLCPSSPDASNLLLA